MATNENEPQPHALTVHDLTVRWKCPRRTIYEAIREGRLHAFRVGKRWLRVTVDEVERFEKAEAA